MKRLFSGKGLCYPQPNHPWAFPPMFRGVWAPPQATAFQRKTTACSGVNQEVNGRPAFVLCGAGRASCGSFGSAMVAIVLSFVLLNVLLCPLLSTCKLH
ncbi:unnamed protein product [Boreogadus saida]